MKPTNLLVLMSDEHNPKALGCYGHPMVKTPHLDALAARGTRFEAAYCNSPVCIPARAVFATGKYIHQVGYWDNADPYEGASESWHHRLRESGHRVDAIGKLHFRSTDDDNGFSKEHLTMHVYEGLGDLLGLIREGELPARGGSWKMADLAGPGESDYIRYDREITRLAVEWLGGEAPKHTDKPWVLFVSWVCPHFPLTAPQEFYDLYPEDQVPWPKQYDKGERPDHPYLNEYGRTFNYDDHFDAEKVRKAVAGYFGLCSFLDDNVGQVLAALKKCGFGGSTRVMYTSDHGDNLGSRGLWGKSTMYEETAGVPLMIAGPDIPSGEVSATPVTHIDCFPSFLEWTGEGPTAADMADRHGISLTDIALGATPERTVFSEYHGMGTTTGAFMIRHGKYKYVHYVKWPPQLYDLEADSEELVDIAAEADMADVLAECERRLRDICDPEDADARAKARQAEQLAKWGRDFVIERGDLVFSPPPGIEVDWQ